MISIQRVSRTIITVPTQTKTELTDKTSLEKATNVEDKYSKLGLVQTHNNLGWMAIKLEPISREFIEYSKICTLPVLDLGTAYGFIPSELLKLKVHVIANDIHMPHLELLYENAPINSRHLLSLNNKSFPNETNFMPNSLSAILASRLFHFLTGEELEIGVKKMFQWLAPGGKVFVFTNAPYRKNMMKFIDEYEKKRKTEKYPGMVKSLNDVNIDQGKYLKETFFSLHG